MNFVIDLFIISWYYIIGLFSLYKGTSICYGAWNRLLCQWVLLYTSTCKARYNHNT